jgi:hypothetical protein
MARINTDNAEKSRGVFAARMERLFLQIPSQASLQVSFQKTAILASRACPVLFLDANSWHFSSSRAWREKQGRSRSERAMCFHNPVQARFVKGFEKAAPAWLAQAPPCAFALSVYILVIRG